MSTYLFIVVHDRHTDTNIYVFPKTDNGIKEANTKFDELSKKYPDGVSCTGYIDYNNVIKAYGYGEDYYIALCESDN